MLVPTGNCAGALLLTVTVPQLSLEIGLPKVTPVATQVPVSTFTVTSAGQVSVGKWLSRTITCCLQVALLPPTSITVQVTRLVPTGNWAGALLFTVKPTQLSAAVGLPKFTPVATNVPGSAFTVTSAGQVIVGFSASITRTMTGCRHTVLLPLASVAVQVTRLVPTGNREGASLLRVTVPQLSVAVGLINTTPVAEQAPGSAFTLMSAGQVITGAWLSRTMTCC